MFLFHSPPLLHPLRFSSISSFNKENGKNTHTLQVDVGSPSTCEWLPLWASGDEKYSERKNEKRFNFGPVAQPFHNVVKRTPLQDMKREENGPVHEATTDVDLFMSMCGQEKWAREKVLTEWENAAERWRSHHVLIFPFISNKASKMKGNHLQTSMKGKKRESRSHDEREIK